MNRRSILIEKYIESSETEVISTCAIIERWHNKYGDRHSFLGQPAEICHYNGQIKYQAWYKKGIQHRDKDLPTVIFYKNEEITSKWFYKNGKLIEESK
jgi:hypothetical protein